MLGNKPKKELRISGNQNLKMAIYLLGDYPRQNSKLAELMGTNWILMKWFIKAEKYDDIYYSKHVFVSVRGLTTDRFIEFKGLREIV